MANCHVCGRGFPTLQEKDAHLAEHPGYGHLRPKPKASRVPAKRLAPLPDALLEAST
jgi:hypothetical protein